MTKLYILICAIVLSGCGETANMQQRLKAAEYCKNYSAELIGWKDMFGNVTRFSCKADGSYYAIPKEALK